MQVAACTIRFSKTEVNIISVHHRETKSKWKLEAFVSWYNFPVEMFQRVGSSLAIFLVKRKLKKDHSDLGKWILLAKLYEVRRQRTEAIKTLKLAKRIFPRSELLQGHLDRLQRGDLSSFDNR